MRERQVSAFEIRVGLVMYGGLALAVYMNGVVQELLEIVRASQRGEAGKSEYWPLLRDAGADFVIDVIAGTSAGGLNGLVLAKALATGSDEMKGMSDLWRTEAQVDRLVQTKDAKAIFSGEIMERNLEAIMKRMSETANRELADQIKVLDLFVTATDLHGRKVIHKELFDRKTVQLRNQHMFHFKKRTQIGAGGASLRLDGRKASRSYYQNDFLSDQEAEGKARDRLLALVGRATSAFPAAFPPQRIGREDAQAADLVHLLPDSERKEFWFSDGGILMNKPFEPVVRTIFQRSADKPVERVLLWVDPDPPAEQKESEPGEPHLLTVLSALPGVLTNEDVVSYLEQIEQQNRYRKQLTEGFVALEARLCEAAAAQAKSLGPAPSGVPAVEGYRSVRKLRMLADLRRCFGSALRGVSGHEEMVEQLVLDIGTAMGDKQDLLGLWDCQYQVRRVQYLLLQLDQYVTDAVRQASAGAKVAAQEPAETEAGRRSEALILARDRKRIKDRQFVVSQVQRYLWNALEDWRNARWVMTNARTQDDDPAIALHMKELVASWGSRPTAVNEVREAVQSYLLWVDQRAQAEVAKAQKVLLDGIGGKPLDPELAAHLAEVWEAFENRDILLLPMTQDGQVMEWDAIDPVLMAPGPTPKVNRPGHEKLASEIAGHFGGFFDPRWRSNDIMWGRLEAAELLCSLVVKEAEKHLPAEGVAELRATSERVLESRMRKILQEEKDSVDAAKLSALVAKSGLEAASAMQDAFDDAAAANQALTGSGMRWVPAQSFWRGLTLQPAEPPDITKLLANAPAHVLWEYLTRVHSVGTEGLGAVRKSVLVNGFLHGLDNLMTALRRNSSDLPVVLRWLAVALVAILKPAKWFFRVVLPWQGPLGTPAWLSGLAGALLLILHFSGVATMNAWAVRGAWTLAGIGALWLVLHRVGQRVLGAALGAALVSGVAWALVLGTRAGAPHGLVDPALGWGFAGLAAFAALLMGLFGGLPGNAPQAGGIVKFELAGSLARSEALIAAWEKVRPGARQRAAFQVGADFLFLLGYAPLLALLVGMGAATLPWAWLRTVGYLVAWSQLLAGALDAVENVGLMQVLSGTKREVWPRVARYAAIAKFTLVFGLGLPFVLVWLGPVLWGWAGPTVTAWAQALWP